MDRKWIQGAINPEHKGQFRAKAEAAGKSTAEFAREKADAPGKTGKQARLAETLMGLRKKKSDGDRQRDRYGSK